MNEINNQNLRPATARVSSVSSENKKYVTSPQVSQEKTTPNGQVAGKLLPPEKQTLPSESKEDLSQYQQQDIKQDVEAAVATMNEYSQNTQRDLHFNMDEKSGRVVVNVIDRDSQEVIRQIPNESFLKLAQKLKEDQAAGNPNPLHLIDENV